MMSILFPPQCCVEVITPIIKLWRSRPVHYKIMKIATIEAPPWQRSSCHSLGRFHDTPCHQSVPNSKLLCWYSAMANFVEFASLLKPSWRFFESWSNLIRAFSIILGNGARALGLNKHSRHSGYPHLVPGLFNMRSGLNNRGQNTHCSHPKAPMVGW